MLFESPESSEFMRVYANWDKLETVFITVDVDFAPDYMIRNITEQLIGHNIAATFFATHKSEYISSLGLNPLFEIGTHPNLSSDSSQGSDFEEILRTLKSFYPGAAGNRFHLLKYSYRDLIRLGQLNFLYDVSTIRFNCPYLLPVYHKDLKMTLLTYSWEDGVCENGKIPLIIDNMGLEAPGIKILNFHPMNVFINSPQSSYRQDFLKENPDLLNCPMEKAVEYRFDGTGAGTAFHSLLEYLNVRKIRSLTLSQLVQQYTGLINE